MSSDDATGLHIIAVLLIVTGLGAVTGTGYQYSETRRFLDQVLSAQGIVVDWIESTSSRSE